jgi:7-cyano-7-deazaguanine reductase
MPSNKYEGLQGRVRAMKTPRIETWLNQYPEKEYLIEMDIPEFTCVCPKTGLPDFADLRLSYMPDRDCLELKSFKLYLTSFRNTGIFHEHVVNRILDDLVAACRPRRAVLKGVFNPRGGITTTVTASYEGKKP